MTRPNRERGLWSFLRAIIRFLTRWPSQGKLESVMTTLGELAARPCIPTYKGGRKTLDPGELEELAEALETWTVEDGKRLCRSWSFPDFVSGLALVNRIGDLAEEVGHHPNITLTWGRVGIDLWTHDVGGLTECDFVFAARCEELLPPEVA
jgi:4a-hydroxytetrahydrobiopterin dehydratase